MVILTKNAHDLELFAHVRLHDRNRVHFAAPVLGID